MDAFNNKLSAGLHMNRFYHGMDTSNNEIINLTNGQLVKSNIPSAATVHFLSKHTTHGSKHVHAESSLFHPHSLQMSHTQFSWGLQVPSKQQ